MTGFFQGFFRMAFGASVVALVILAVRPILKKYSNRIACLLWAVLTFRLLCPFVIESPALSFVDRWERLEASAGTESAAQGKVDGAADAKAYGEVDGKTYGEADGASKGVEIAKNSDEKLMEVSKAGDEKLVSDAKSSDEKLTDVSASNDGKTTVEAKAAQGEGQASEQKAAQGEGQAAGKSSQGDGASYAEVKSSQGEGQASEQKAAQGDDTALESIAAQDKDQKSEVVSAQGEDQTSELKTSQGEGQATETKPAQSVGQTSSELVSSQSKDVSVSEIAFAQDDGQAAEVKTAQDNGKTTEVKTAQGENKLSLVDRIGMAFVRLTKSVRTWFASVPGKSVTNVCGVFWLFGAIAFLILGARKYIMITGKLREAIPCGRWAKYPVKISDAQGVPMSFGVVRRGIYVPSSFEKFFEAASAKSDAQGSMASAKPAMQGSDGAQELILWHEATHLRHLDPLWKLLSFVALAIHWWNPLVWLCVRCMNQDMEMACDESVLKQVGLERKEAYAKTILDFATAHSGLSMAAAFGESHAESRIKNALRYRKTPVWLSAILLAFIVLLGGCLVTNPSSKEEEDQETQASQSKVEIQEEEYKEYSTVEALIEDQTQRMTEKLAKEAKISEADELVCAWEGARNKPQEDYWKEGIHYPYEFYWATFTKDGEIHFYYSLFDYYEKTPDGEKERHYFLGKGEDIEIEAVTNLETAKKVYPFAGANRIRPYERQENVPDFDGWTGPTDAQYIASVWEETASEKAIKLGDPVSATEVLLKLQGGHGSYVERSFTDGYVEWQFDNGEVAHYWVYKTNGFWEPMCLMEWIDEIDQERFPGTSSSNMVEQFEKSKRDKEYLQSLTIEELRGSFVSLCDIPGKDVTLYGKIDGNTMILRVGNELYPLMNAWSGNKETEIQFACGDYDKDGQDEYAIILPSKSNGIGKSRELFVVEIRPNGAVVNQFTLQDRFGYLEDVLTYHFDEKEKSLLVSVNGGWGSRSYLKDELSADAKAEELIYAIREDVTPVDDELFYRCDSHFRTTDDQTWPGRSAGMDIMARLEYHDDGTFTMETPSFRDYESSRYIDEGGLESFNEYIGEEIISVREAELTRDGVPDLIVTSVTYQADSKKFPWKERMEEHGDVCRIRVYDGNDASILAGEYPTQKAIWLSEVFHPYEWDEYIFLCEKNGKSYILDGTHGPEQGDLSLGYSVYAFGPNGIYEIDDAAINVDFNVPESQWPMDEMLEYTEKLYDWIGDAKLIACVEHDWEYRISSFDRNARGDYLQRPVREASYGAWEIWNILNEIISKDIEEAKNSDRISIGEPETVQFTDMDSLKTELQKLNRNWRMLADWQKKHSYLSRIEVDLQDGRNVVTCDLTHDGIQETITVEYADVEKDSQALLLLDVRNAQKEFMWEGTLG
ncbi:MAG: hypothetical protein J6Z33_08130, partial [Lachnospiraceae bacterium]|nr:hypothetical protein [Lachnospiraceae bacterium]